MTRPTGLVPLFWLLMVVRCRCKQAWRSTLLHAGLLRLTRNGHRKVRRQQQPALAWRCVKRQHALPSSTEGTASAAGVGEGRSRSRDSRRQDGSSAVRAMRLYANARAPRRLHEATDRSLAVPALPCRSSQSRARCVATSQPNSKPPCRTCHSSRSPSDTQAPRTG